MTMSVTEESSLKDKSHFPLSLSGDDIQVNNESSFHQSIKEKNKENVHSLNKTLNQSVLKSSGSPHK
jgi:P pilus assembly chaperone PapD